MEQIDQTHPFQHQDGKLFRMEAPYCAAFTNKLRGVNNRRCNQAFVFAKSCKKRHPNTQHEDNHHDVKLYAAIVSSEDLEEVGTEDPHGAGGRFNPSQDSNEIMSYQHFPYMGAHQRIYQCRCSASAWCILLIPSPPEKRNAEPIIQFVREQLTKSRSGSDP
jgi:hypothetical protein